MSNGPVTKTDLIPAVNHDKLPHVLFHPTLGLYLGDGLWSRDQRDEMKAKINLIESVPTFRGDANLSKVDLGPVGWSAVQMATVRPMIEKHLVIPADASSDKATPRDLRTYGIPAWGNK